MRAAAPEAHRYPDGDAVRLRRAIGERSDLDPDRIVCGAGSDELIQLLMRAYAGPGDEVLYSAHGFLMYKLCALGVGATPVAAPEPELIADVDVSPEAIDFSRAQVAGISTATLQIGNRGTARLTLSHRIEPEGQGFSATLPEREYADPRSLQVGVDIDRPTLDPRIARRVAEMFDAGFVDEVRRLLGAGLAKNIGENHAVSFSLFDDPHVYVPLIGMGLLALLPILIGKLRGKKLPSESMKP